MPRLFRRGPVREEQRDVDLADFALDKGADLLGVFQDEQPPVELARADQVVLGLPGGSLPQQALDLGRLDRKSVV